MTHQEALARFQNGETFDATQVFDVGFRAGERDGYRVEGDALVKYGPAEWVDGRLPCGTKREIVSRGVGSAAAHEEEE